jgi:hypothetical protein
MKNQRDWAKWEDLADLQDLRHAQRQREMWLKYAATVAVNQCQAFAGEVEGKAIRKVSRLLGVEVHPTTHKCPFDLFVGGVKVEVKGSHWQHKARRYQAAVRNYEADVLLFDAVNGIDHWFVIPMDMIAPRRQVEVYSYHVESYKGRWAAWLEAWDVLDEIVRKCPSRAIQLSLGV